MIHRKLKDIAKMITVQNDLEVFGETEIKGVTFNTRELVEGNLFIPLKGESRDGHEFVEQAIEQGAAASLWQADVPNPPSHLPLLVVEDTLKALQQLAKEYRKQLNVKVAGVTGSNGKTTTKDILAELLATKFKVQKTIGNYNNEIGLPVTILGLKEDTEVAVLEMGMSNFGEIELLTNLAEPDAALITNIGEAHLQELGSREGIARAKMEILTGLKDGGLFVYPGEEPLIREKLANMENAWTIQTFGKSNQNDLFPTSLRMAETESIFAVNQSKEIFHMPVLGEYNVLNALAAMLIAKRWGVPFEEMNKAFTKLKVTNMRMEMLEGKNGSKIINDAYNASPTSTKAVMNLVENIEGYSKKMVVLGDMLELGPNEIEFHAEVGRVLNPQKIDFVYTFGELAKTIANSAKDSFRDETVFSFTNKEELVQHLLPKLDSQTLVVVKASRGMKLEEVVEAIKN